MKPTLTQRILALWLILGLTLPGPAHALRQEPPAEAHPATLTGLEENLSENLGETVAMTLQLLKGLSQDHRRIGLAILSSNRANLIYRRRYGKISPEAVQGINRLSLKLLSSSAPSLEQEPQLHALWHQPDVAALRETLKKRRITGLLLKDEENGDKALFSHPAAAASRLLLALSEDSHLENSIVLSHTQFQQKMLPPRTHTDYLGNYPEWVEALNGYLRVALQKIPPDPEKNFLGYVLWSGIPSDRLRSQGVRSIQVVSMESSYDPGRLASQLLDWLAREYPANKERFRLYFRDGRICLNPYFVSQISLSFPTEGALRSVNSLQQKTNRALADEFQKKTLSAVQTLLNAGVYGVEIVPGKPRDHSLSPESIAHDILSHLPGALLQKPDLKEGSSVLLSYGQVRSLLGNRRTILTYLSRRPELRPETNRVLLQFFRDTPDRPPIDPAENPAGYAVQQLRAQNVTDVSIQPGRWNGAFAGLEEGAVPTLDIAVNDARFRVPARGLIGSQPINFRQLFNLLASKRLLPYENHLDIERRPIFVRRRIKKAGETDNILYVFRNAGVLAEHALGVFSSVADGDEIWIGSKQLRTKSRRKQSASWKPSLLKPTRVVKQDGITEIRLNGLPREMPGNDTAGLEEKPPPYKNLRASFEEVFRTLRSYDKKYRIDILAFYVDPNHAEPISIHYRNENNPPPGYDFADMFKVDTGIYPGEDEARESAYYLFIQADDEGQAGHLHAEVMVHPAAAGLEETIAEFRDRSYDQVRLILREHRPWSFGLFESEEGIPFPAYGLSDENSAEERFVYDAEELLGGRALGLHYNVILAARPRENDPDAIHASIIPLAPTAGLEETPPPLGSRPLQVQRATKSDFARWPVTYLNRWPAQMRLLRETVVPSLLERNRESRTLDVWVLGGAMGEEPATVLTVILQALEDRKVPIDPDGKTGWKVSVHSIELEEAAYQESRRRLAGLQPLRWENLLTLEGERTALELAGTLNRQRKLLPRLLDPIRGDAADPALIQRYSQADLIVCNAITEETPAKTRRIFEALAASPRAWILTSSDHFALLTGDHLLFEFLDPRRPWTPMFLGQPRASAAVHWPADWAELQQKAVPKTEDWALPSTEDFLLVLMSSVLPAWHRPEKAWPDDPNGYLPLLEWIRDGLRSREIRLWPSAVRGFQILQQRADLPEPIRKATEEILNFGSAGLEEGAAHPWHPAILQRLKLGLEFLPIRFSEDGYVYHVLGTGLLEGVRRGRFQTRNPNSFFYVSEDFEKDIVPLMRGYMENAALSRDSALLVIPASRFNEALRAGQAAVEYHPGRGKYPFFAGGIDLGAVEHLVVHPDTFKKLAAIAGPQIHSFPLDEDFRGWPKSLGIQSAREIRDEQLPYPRNPAAGMEEGEALAVEEFVRRYPDQAANVPQGTTHLLTIPEGSTVRLYRLETLAGMLGETISKDRESLPAGLRVLPAAIPPDASGVQTPAVFLWDPMLGKPPYSPSVPMVEQWTGQPMAHPLLKLVAIALFGRLDATQVRFLTVWAFEQAGRQVAVFAIQA